MMKFLFASLLAIIAISSLAQSSPSIQNWPGDFIEGTWIMPTKNGAVGETWKKVDDTYYQSRGFIIKGKDTITTEQVALRKTATGIFYTSTVPDQNNQQPVPFKLTAADNKRFIFENPEHDFPKRIVCEFTGDDSLHAFIDDGLDGKKSQHFYYKKVK